MKCTVNYFISGRVQGVNFRMATSEQANLLGISGWVRNLADGRVEVMASGSIQDMDEFYKWLTKGPDLARVLQVESVAVEPQDFTNFTINY